MNGSSRNNETEQYVFLFSVEEQVCFSVAYFAILFVAVTGNSFVIHVTRKLLLAGRGPFNILVINMAASDILFAITVVTIHVSSFYSGGLWLSGGLGTFLCKFSQFAVHFAISSSILTLTAMTIDRYLAIVPNVKKPLTRKNILKIISAILFFSFVSSSVSFFKINTSVYSKKELTFCYVLYSGEKDVNEKLLKAEYISSFIILYVLPVVVMSVLYFFIIRFLWLRKIPGNITNQNEIQRRKQLRKVICMLVTMATSFAVTWFPVYVLQYYQAYGNVSILPSFLKLLLFFSAHTNCATNPSFYLVFNKKYRDELLRIRCCCKKSQGEDRAQEINLQ